MGAVTCLVVDDSTEMLSSLVALLEHEGFDVIGEANSGLHALQILETKHPDLAVLDFSLPEMTGIEVARQAASLGLATVFVIHTAIAGAALVRDALDAGVHGIARKAVPPAALLYAIAAAIAGEVYVDPAILRSF